VSVIKLKVAEVAEWRRTTLAMQQGRCALCKLACAESQAVADHCHTTGFMRAVLHRSCNALLGKVENNYRRYGVSNLAAWAAGMPAYLQHHAVRRHPQLHPSHKTAEEKRLARNAKARKTRAKRKAA
jgi:hypothetical protein